MRLLDVVATKLAFPEGGLCEGQVGTVVAILDDENALVEFADLNGVAYTTIPIPNAALLELKHGPVNPREF